MSDNMGMRLQTGADELLKNNGKEEWNRIFSKDGKILYEGTTYKNKPCGVGVTYFENGKKYQEGSFGIKGLLSGKEYYPNGKLRFEGEFKLNKAYGPNSPKNGSFYDLSGSLVYQGEFIARYGSVGYPSIIIPKEYGSIQQKEHPKDLHYLMWDD